MSKKTKVYIQFGTEWEVAEKAEWMIPVSSPTLHGVGVTQTFRRSDGEEVVASKLVGQNYWVYDKVDRSQ